MALHESTKGPGDHVWVSGFSAVISEDVAAVSVVLPQGCQLQLLLPDIVEQAGQILQTGNTKGADRIFGLWFLFHRSPAVVRVTRMRIT